MAAAIAGKKHWCNEQKQQESMALNRIRIFVREILDHVAYLTDAPFSIALYKNFLSLCMFVDRAVSLAPTSIS
ncbi:MAG: hypothetical protein IPG64_06205 [Haliea sp.]|nr:hypothetical protein [Haliea sp.]